VADFYGLPFEITAKTLLRLKDAGLIESAQGARGGYTLLRDLTSISFVQFLEIMEGPQSLVACTSLAEQVSEPPCHCDYEPKCEIKSVLNQLNSQVVSFLSQIRLSDLTEVGLEKPLPVAFGKFGPLSADSHVAVQQVKL
jgi:Rrf2 family protein